MKKVGIAVLFIILCLIAALFIGVFDKNNSNNVTIKPTSSPVPTAADELMNMTLHEKIESLLIVHTKGTDPIKLSRFISTFHPAGLIFMSDNIPKDLSKLSEETNAIQKASGVYPSLIAIDEEGCTVKRLPDDIFNCAFDLKNKSPEETKKAFEQRSLLLKKYGINFNFGIVADITANTRSFIYPRVYGSDPHIVGRHIAAAVEGSEGITLSTIKHFPGHGETVQNSHITIPVVTITQEQWEMYDKVPFQSGLSADALMFGHLIYSAIDSRPASLSNKWHAIAKQMGFNNLMITDNMVMLQKSGEKKYQDPGQNAVDALKAGNDLILFVNDFNIEEEPEREVNLNAIIRSVENAVSSGMISEKELDTHVRKVFSFRKHI